MDQVIVQEKELIRVLKINQPIIELKPKAVSLVDLLSALERGKVVLHHIDERLQTYNDVAINLNISEIKEDIQKLLKDCNYLVETLGEESLRSRIAQYNIDWDTLYCIIEK
jgi:pyrimidine operon attenuation protein/uracil phosphoribosyltransferase